MSGTALIIAGGSRPDPLVVNAVPTVAFSVAVDGGADNARAVGIEIDALVGDMDSISQDCLAAAKAAGVDIDEHPQAKDETDLELGFRRALAESPDKIVVIGIGGGRVDHQLANVAVLGAEEYRSVAVEALVGSARLTVIRGNKTLFGALGETVSLLAINGRATGITTKGLQYPLNDEPLDGGSARGVSNVFAATEALVTVEGGALLAVQPFSLKKRDG